MKGKTLEELRKEWENQPWYKTVYYFLYRRVKAIIDLPRTIKWFLQRLFRGYDDQDVWNFNSFILRKLYKPLKAFVNYEAEHGMGLPMEFKKDPAGWLNVLRDVEYAFDQIYKEEYDIDEYMVILNNMNPEQKQAHQERIQKGCELFGKYWRNFWD